MNDFFRSILEVNQGAGARMVEASIAALRRTSVANNDLPARLGDVLGFFSAVPRPSSSSAVWGATSDDLRLRRVKNRLSASVLYNYLWTWRSYFGREETRIDSSDATSFRGGSEGMLYYLSFGR
ncbi:zn 2cys6 transcriptional activator [Colletotrichum truncatum]|uniref:Zn 2cys6 transcriptional activator n=1 Tax=Colletotrichum truncatum TaxID=5467 RepID=A0ACC3YDA9_COLTU